MYEVGKLYQSMTDLSGIYKNEEINGYDLIGILKKNDIFMFLKDCEIAHQILLFNGKIVFIATYIMQNSKKL